MILEVSVPRGMKYCTLYTIGIGKHPCILFCSAQFFDHYDINKSGLFSIHHKALFGIFPLLPPSSANKGNDHACLIGEHWEATNASLMAAEVANRSRAKLEEHREKLRLERSERKFWKREEKKTTWAEETLPTSIKENGTPVFQLSSCTLSHDRTCLLSMPAVPLLV
eukprot:1161191-Pelagomonas_calceolata.AAC.6